jgi:surfactin synthase thioesterase subunit
LCYGVNPFAEPAVCRRRPCALSGVDLGLHQWVARRVTTGAPHLRVFCFPYAGGSVQPFGPLAEAVPDGVDVSCLQVPWGMRGPGAGVEFDSIGAVARAASRALAPLLDRPFALVGYSMGALVAYELARILADAGRSGPSHLVVLSQRAPHIPSGLPPLTRLPHAEFVRRVNARYGGIPAAVLQEPDLIERLVPSLRAELSLVETYRWAPSPPLSCGITALAGARDATLDRPQLDAWQHTTLGAVETAMLEAGHFILTEARGPAIAAICRPLALLSAGLRREGT